MASSPQVTVRVGDELVSDATLAVSRALGAPVGEVPRLIRAGLYALTMLTDEGVETAWALADRRRGWPARRRSEGP